jgi:hypothetical protein
MYLSSREVREVTLGTAAWAGVGALFTLGSIFIRQCCDQTSITPKTRALQGFPDIINLMLQIEEIREYNEEAWVDMVETADQVALIYQRAERSNPVDIRVGYEMAEHEKTQCKLAMSDLLKSAQQQSAEMTNCKNVAKIRMLCNSVYSKLRDLTGRLSKVLVRKLNPEQLKDLTDMFHYRTKRWRNEERAQTQEPVSQTASVSVPMHSTSMNVAH